MSKCDWSPLLFRTLRFNRSPTSAPVFPAEVAITKATESPSRIAYEVIFARIEAAYSIDQAYVPSDGFKGSEYYRPCTYTDALRFVSDPELSFPVNRHRSPIQWDARDEWCNRLTPEMYDKSHRALQHPTKSSELEIWQRAYSGSLPAHVRRLITERKCKICAHTATLPRRPRVAITHGPEVNNVVTADVMTFTYKTEIVSRSLLWMRQILLLRYNCSLIQPPHMLSINF